MTAEFENPVNDIPLLASRYRLGVRRGNAIDATLFEAFDEQLGRAVAVKLIHPDLSADPGVQTSFRANLDQVAAVHHPNLVAVHEWGRTTWNGHEVLYMVTEHLGGGSLRDVLDRGRLLSPSQALVVGLDACKALDTLHRHGVVHGEIRPGTLLFGDDRRLRVVDAGLATVLEEPLGGPTARINDVAKYCSPEEAKGLPVEPKSDVYALSLTLVEALTGSVPFAGDSTVATLAGRVDKLLPVSADLGPLASVLERAARPDAAGRYTAAEFGRALVQVAERLPRPEPLPLPTLTLFGSEMAGAEALLDVSGAFPRPAAAAVVATAGAAAVLPPPAAGADVTVAPPPVPVAPAAPSPVAATAPRSSSTSSSSGAPVPVSAVVVPSVTPITTDLDPADDFPEPVESGSSGRRWIIAVLVLLAVAGGVLAWFSTRPQHRTVPAVAAMAEGEALNQLAGDFNATVTQEASDTVDAGKVIRTDPAAGTQVKKGADVAVYVSTGPAPRVLPEVTGLTVQQATSKLEGMGLVVKLGKPTFSEHVPVGQVISWTVPASPAVVAGGTVTKGTDVLLVVSGGPAPRTVPSLVGLTVAEATTKLKAEQLAIAVSPKPEFSTTIPKGHIVRTSPRGGDTAKRGSTVTVVLSKGPDIVVLPKATGLSYPQLRAELVKVGFKVGVVNGDTTQPPVRYKVKGAVAFHGDSFPRGTTVDIVYPAKKP
jgi:serine/threonine-protein kinase